MRGAQTSCCAGGASGSDGTRHGDFFDRSEALLRSEASWRSSMAASPAAVRWSMCSAWCVILGIVCGSLYPVSADAISKYARKLTEVERVFRTFTSSVSRSWASCTRSTGRLWARP